MRDFDRPLHDRGRTDAERLGRELAARNLVPAKVLCSAATRAAQTWAEVARGLPDVPVTYDKALYSEDGNTYMDAIRGADADPLLIIGHNPMLEDIVHALDGDKNNRSQSILETGYPTCGLAVFELDGTPGCLETGSARLTGFLAPGRY